MIGNYHAHTYRCHHAEGCEKEYIENAVRGGLKMLGFTDHTPYDIPFPKPFRMTPEELRATSRRPAPWPGAIGTKSRS